METGYDGPLVNIGTGEDVTIRELAETVMDVVGFSGDIVFDASKPDGTPRKLLDVSRLKSLGWSATDPAEGRASAWPTRPRRSMPHPSCSDVVPEAAKALTSSPINPGVMPCKPCESSQNPATIRW
jgi:hypothetical protein